MLKKTIAYVDFNGDEQSEDFYFNLTKAELAEMELSAGGLGFAEELKKIVSENDAKKIIEHFKGVIDVSFGVRSSDGKRFIKTPELLAEFKSTAAYSELFIELATDANAASTFVNGIVPVDLNKVKSPELSAAIRKASEEAMQGHKQKAQPEPETIISPAPVEPSPAPRLTQQDLVSLPREELEARLRQQGLVDGFQGGMQL